MCTVLTNLLNESSVIVWVNGNLTESSNQSDEEFELPNIWQL